MPVFCGDHGGLFSETESARTLNLATLQTKAGGRLSGLLPVTVSWASSTAVYPPASGSRDMNNPATIFSVLKRDPHGPAAYNGELLRFKISPVLDGSRKRGSWS